MKTDLLRLIGVCLCLSTSQAFASTLTESATYLASDNDTTATAKTACVAKAARKALESSGTLVSSSMTLTTTEADGRVNDKLFQRVKSWVGSIVQTNTIQMVPAMEEDYLRVSCVVQVSFDPDQIREILRQVALDDSRRESPTEAPPPKFSSRHEEIEAKWRQLRDGMSYQEVVDYMGVPDRRIDPRPSDPLILGYGKHIYTFDNESSGTKWP